MNFQHKILDASINIWTENIENPTIYDIVENKKYEFQGKYEVFFLEYHDETGNSLKNYSDRIGSAFYGLCIKIEQIELKLLIKGCVLSNYIIPRLQYSIYTTHLTLGKRIDKEFVRINLFDPEEDVNQIATVQEQKAYYNQWLKSIEGLPY
ncbi:hypothetical protein ETU10_05390 [Apibacter muscae]|nr:hypothetical protein ETU10_05390 [Apibacter muscae]